MRLTKRHRKPLTPALAALLGAFLVIGCGSDNSDFVSNTGTIPNTGRVTIRDDGQPISPTGDTADTLELEAFNAQGELVYGPVTTPLRAVNVFEGVPRPPLATRLQIDYLRNGGFLLFRAEVDADGQVEFSDPDEQPVDPHTSSFSVQPSGDGFQLVRSIQGASISVAEQDNQILSQQSDESTTYTGPLKLKGVCYSPAPINFSNKLAPAVGDLFWDTYREPVNNTEIFNWYGLWGFGALGDSGYFARDDLKQIRDMGANSIRVYSMTSRQLGSDGSIPEPGSGTHYLHKTFLDRCWNNGNRPIYVMVGIPLPDVCFRADIAPKAGQIEFWEHVLTETVEDVRNHPAVIGFVIMNEHDAEPTTFPRDPSFPNRYEPGEPSELTEYFYSQTAKYADTVKELAPDKLVGWALHDVPEFVQFASVRPETGPTYMEQLSSFDFWGINTYHNDSFDAIFSPNNPGNYTNLPDNVKKPVLFTEIGWPATTHKDGKLYEDETTHKNVAEAVLARFPEALNNPLVLGTMYFEFQDEWWKQAGGLDYTWDPTTAAPNNFPNKYWDEEGFGLFSTKVTAPRQPTDSPYPENSSGPTLPLDTLTPRIPIIDAVRKVYTDN